MIFLKTVRTFELAKNSLEIDRKIDILLFSNKQPSFDLFLFLGAIEETNFLNLFFNLLQIIYKKLEKKTDFITPKKAAFHKINSLLKKHLSSVRLRKLEIKNSEYFLSKDKARKKSILCR